MVPVWVGAETVNVADAGWLVVPYSSVAVTETLYVPVDVYVCVVDAPVPVVPSPKFHLYVNPAA